MPGELPGPAGLDLAVGQPAHRIHRDPAVLAVGQGADTAALEGGPEPVPVGAAPGGHVETAAVGRLAQRHRPVLLRKVDVDDHGDDAGQPMAMGLMGLPVAPVTVSGATTSSDS